MTKFKKEPTMDDIRKAYAAVSCGWAYSFGFSYMNQNMTIIFMGDYKSGPKDMVEWANGLEDSK